MKKIIALSLLAFLVSGCASTLKNPITQTRVDILNASWGAALATFNGYKDACIRRVIHASCRTVVQRVQVVIPSVHSKVVAAREFALRPTLTTVDLITVADSAVNDFKAFQSLLGVK